MNQANTASEANWPKTDIRLRNGQDGRPHDPGAEAQVIDRLARQERGERIGII